jgi:hypothetical protein
MRRASTGVVLLLAAVAASAQPQPRRATNIAALTTYPGFFHLRPVIVVGRLTLAANGELRVADDSGSLRVVFTGSPPDGEGEVRGDFLDIGRMNADDPRLASEAIARAFRPDPDAPWPRPGTVTGIMASAITPATPPSSSNVSVRSVALYPFRYLDQKITVTGQFAGRNLLGDLPDAPGRSKYDFVLRSADAAIWVTGLRPRGRDFELALDARIDTGRWLEVTGTLQQGRGLLWLDGAAGSLRLTKPPVETTSADPIRVPAAPPPEVLFSAPTHEEIDVSVTTTIRIQFSRDINPATLKNHIQAGYAAASGKPEEPDTPIAGFATQYRPANRVLEIRFTDPLERFRTVRVRLLDGILGTDQQAMKPWTLSFITGAE